MNLRASRESSRCKETPLREISICLPAKSSSPARPKGRPQLTDFRLEETAIPAPASGQLLLETQYLSLDPYMRGRMDDRKSYATPVRLGDVMGGEAVARVLVSNRATGPAPRAEAARKLVSGSRFLQPAFPG